MTLSIGTVSISPVSKEGELQIQLTAIIGVDASDNSTIGNMNVIKSRSTLILRPAVSA